ncbi:MAG: nuclear transport factor 2 family protein [Rhizobacter sp.]|nr:nuclear transport factor 2 family protein [Ferruginibacter sp.]
MKYFIFFAGMVLLSSVTVSAQHNDLTKEIDEQVWKPFIRYFNSDDREGFKSVHSKEVTRVIQDGKDIFGYEQYFKPLPDSLKNQKTEWIKNIELRFVQRIAKNDRAFEVGYYKTTYTNNKTGEKTSNIGKFHVLIRRENGVWKIWMDADTSEGATEDAFNKAEVIQ